MHHRPFGAPNAFTAVSTLALITLLVGCSESPAAKAPPTCTDQAALTAPPGLNGLSLGSKELALTFDDGPGARTSELSSYLKSEGIRAAFFVNGHCFDEGNPCGNTLPAETILAQLVSDGHVVANHTHTHAALTSLSAEARQEQLAATDAIIAPYVTANRFMFRAPYGDWDGNAHDSLMSTPMSKYVGHIDWEIGSQRTATTAADWACWQTAPELTSKACGDLYLTETLNVGKGIVLLHDPLGNLGNTDVSSGTGNTVDMVKYLVPLLKAQGFTFKRVDEVPEIAALLPPLPPPGGKTEGNDGRPHVDSKIPPVSPGQTDDPCAPTSSMTTTSAAR